MFYYAQVDNNNICIGISQLSGEVVSSNMIPIDINDRDILGKRYNNGQWDEIEQPKPMYEPTEQEILQAEMLLNQQQIISKQTEIDMTLAELLLNQQGVGR